MGKIGRFACILTPMLLTLASLLCIAIVMAGQTPWKGNNAPSTALGRDLYFFKVRLGPIKLPIHCAQVSDNNYRQTQAASPPTQIMLSSTFPTT